MTDLYRHFDKDGKLLYVGVSLSTMKRLSQHKKASHWFNEITSVTIQKYKSRQEALDAERSAIVEENPIHNLKRPTVKEVKRIEDDESTGAQKSRDNLVKRIVQFNPVYTIDEASSITGVSKPKIKELISLNKIGYVCVGERVTSNGVRKILRITGWQLIDYIENLEAGNKL